MKYISVLFLLLFFYIANLQEKNIYEASYSSQKIIIDGLPNDSVWNTCEWDDIEQLWLGSPVSPDDFTGKYKLAWTETFIYVFAMITCKNKKGRKPLILQCARQVETNQYSKRIWKTVI